MKNWALVAVLAPLLGSVIAGLGSRIIGRRGAHAITIAAVALSFIASMVLLQQVLQGHTFNGTIYTWSVIGHLHLEIGFLIDRLSVLMMGVVTFVSLMVHVYTIGYMADDPGYQRFFSYINLFTFSMLMLVLANNLLQLFFGWEAVGLVSYLLIGFWYTRESAIFASLKAFLVNRVGDFGFILGIALIFATFGTLDYNAVFALAPSQTYATLPLWGSQQLPLITTICLALFVGAMGKSAQVPLHVWLPDSMEGPTPISALIHAATMVTAGIFMVSRMSPLFELSQTALSVILIIGAITALFMGLVAIVQYDIKRVVAYSTLSQLGYMTMALGASAYPLAIFHLFTHAFFKALLFLGAGSVIIAMHHEQDMRHMGGLRKYMPITYAVMVIGTLAIIGFPLLSGFYSKESIIEALHLSQQPGAHIAYYAALVGVFITSLYSFRLLFLTFHGQERFADHDGHGAHRPHESPWVVTVPLMLLAIASIIAGWWIGDVALGDYFGNTITIAAAHNVVTPLHEEFHGVLTMAFHALGTVPFWLTVAGALMAWYAYLHRPQTSTTLRLRLSWLVAVLERKYGFDDLYQWLFAHNVRRLGASLWKNGDQNAIDGIINGTAATVARGASLLRLLQNGRLTTYALAMMVGLFMLLALWTLQYL